MLAELSSERERLNAIRDELHRLQESSTADDDVIDDPLVDDTETATDVSMDCKGPMGSANVAATVPPGFFYLWYLYFDTQLEVHRYIFLSLF